MELQQIPQQSHLLNVFQEVLSTKNKEERKQLASNLWNSIVDEKANPLIDEDSAYFFYGGTDSTSEVLLAGDWTHWRPGGSLKRIEHTNLFYTTQNFDKTARLQYKIIVDGVWQLDSANHRIAEEGFGVNSEFWMAEYVDESWLHYSLGVVKEGNIAKHTFKSTELDYEKTIFTYLPPVDFTLYKSFPLLVVHDGEEALSIGRYQHIVDNLIFAKKIPPIVMVFVKPNNRHLEYIDNDNYIRFVTEEVVPFIRSFAEKNGIKISDKRKDRAVIGASLGGLLSTYTVLKYPKTFGVCIAQSPSYWWNKGEIYKSPYLRNASEIFFILQTGTVCDARDLTFFMKNRLLQHKVKNVRYSEFVQGHTWGNWKSNFANSLLEWFSDKKES